MNTSWLPYLLSLVTLLIAGALARNTDTPEDKVADEAGSIRQVAGNVVAITNEEPWWQPKIVISKLKHSAAYARANLKLILVVTTFPLIATRSPLSELMLPYVSKRYGWSLGKVCCSFTFSQLVLIFPGRHSRHLERYHRSFSMRGTTATHIASSRCSFLSPCTGRLSGCALLNMRIFDRSSDRGLISERCPNDYR